MSRFICVPHVVQCSWPHLQPVHQLLLALERVPLGVQPPPRQLLLQSPDGKQSRVVVFVGDDKDTYLCMLQDCCNFLVSSHSRGNDAMTLRRQSIFVCCKHDAAPPCLELLHIHAGRVEPVGAQPVCILRPGRPPCRLLGRSLCRLERRLCLCKLSLGSLLLAGSSVRFLQHPLSRRARQSLPSMTH